MSEEIEKTPADVPYIAFESAQARLERTIYKLWVAVILLIVLLVGSNVAWIWYESQFEDITVTAEQTADGQSNNYAIGGDYLGGKTEGDNQAEDP